MMNSTFFQNCTDTLFVVGTIFLGVPGVPGPIPESMFIARSRDALTIRVTSASTTSVEVTKKNSKKRVAKRKSRCWTVVIDSFCEDSYRFDIF